jgi:5-formyltetrahydrofolate cyclo-ligase
MLKNEARALYRHKRNELPATETVKLDDLLLIQFQSADLPFLEAILSFWPIEENNEPNTHLFTEFLRFRNPEVKIAYPVADFKSMTMTAMAVDIDTTFTKKDLNIYEPDEGEPILPNELDLVMVPMLAFDKRGYRVGYGKGFYDKYLAGCRKDCIKVGFSYFEPVAMIQDANEFDVPLDICITPHTVYVF